jgi:hypothetical protein
MITRQELDSSVTQTLDKVEQVVSATPVSLVRGQNLVSVTSDGVVPFNVLADVTKPLKGRTLVNLLGRDGNCEDTSKWATSGAGCAIALDSSNKVYGSNGIKITLGSDTNGAVMRDILSSLKTGSYYIVLAEFKVGTATKGHIRFQSNASGTYVQSFGNDVVSTSAFGLSYLKVQPSDFASKTNFWVYAQFEGASGNTGWVDGFRIYEITQAEYNALGTTLTDINAIAQKYPYVDDMKGLNGVYVNVIGQNIHSPFLSADSTIHANAKAVDLYSLDHTPTLQGTSTTTYDHSTPVSVVGSAYTTSASARPQKLSNGWIVTAETSGSTVYFQVSKDGGATFNPLTTLTITTTGGWSICSKGTIIYFVGTSSNATTLTFYTFDATTVPSSITTGDTNYGYKTIDTSQSAFNGCSITIDSNGKQWATWASKNSTYPNSFNIRVSSSTDGTTWASPTQLTTYNSTGLDVKNPCVVIKGNGYPIILVDSNGTAAVEGIYYTNYNGTSWSSLGTVYTNDGYTQSNPSAVVDSAGVIHVTWQGYDSTDVNPTNIRYSKSTDGGATWSAMLKLTSGNVSGQGQYYPSITADKNNNVYVLWRGIDSAVNATYNQIRKIVWNGSAWGSITTITSNTTGDAVNPSTLANYTDFTDPLTIYMDNVAGAVKFRGVWNETVATTISSEESSVTLPVIGGQQYSFSMAYNTMTVLIQELDSNGSVITTINSGNSIGSQITWTTSTNAVKAKIIYRVTATGTYSVRQPMLNLGSVLPFVPRNDDYVYFQTELNSSVDGTVYDSLVIENGQAVKTPRFKSMVLDGSLPWAFDADFTGYKSVKVSVTSSTGAVANSGTAVKYDGKILTSFTGAGNLTASDQQQISGTSGYLYLTIPDTDSGWLEAWNSGQIDTAAIQRYMNGWKLCDSAGNAYVSGTQYWKSVVDGTGLTSDVNLATNTLAPNYKAGKLMFQLSQPIQEVVTTEGLVPNLNSGMNQIELGEGIVFRENFVPLINNADGYYYINTQTDTGNATLKNKADRFVVIYKNGQPDLKWSLFTKPSSSQFIGQYGYGNAKIAKSDYDPTASYSATYVRPNYTSSSSIPSLDATYESNLRKDVDRNTQSISDLYELATTLQNTKADKQQGGWITVSGWLNGWTHNDPNNPVRYRLEQGGSVCRVIGAMKGGTVGQTAFYFPSAYKPIAPATVVTLTDTTTPSRVSVDATGKLVPNDGSTNYTYLDMTFPVK